MFTGHSGTCTSQLRPLPLIVHFSFVHLQAWKNRCPAGVVVVMLIQVCYRLVSHQTHNVEIPGTVNASIFLVQHLFAVVARQIKAAQKNIKPCFPPQLLSFHQQELSSLPCSYWLGGPRYSLNWRCFASKPCITYILLLPSLDQLLL